MSPWKLMTLPFLECLVLVGIHSYLGLHVLRRKVIFVDLALAQIAALGSIVAIMAGLEQHTTGSYVFSLLFTFVGAAVFSLTRLRQEKVPQEAVIGLVYALAAGVGILLIDRAPHGAEHIKEVLTGTILWVDGKTVLTAAVVYSGVGIFHYIFRQRFIEISEDPDGAFERGVKVRLWDFLFYMSFGLVITVSVHTAGVLLVFVFLVVPAIMGMSITDKISHQLIIGWAAGALVSFLGMGLSYAWDFPAGPMVVSVYGFMLLLVALSLFVLRAEKRGKALLHLAYGLAATAAVVLMFVGLAKVFAHLEPAEGHHHHHAQMAQHEDHAQAGAGQANHAGRGQTAHYAGKTAPVDALLKKLAAADDAQKILVTVQDSTLLESALFHSEDEDLKLQIAIRLLRLDQKHGIAQLLDLLGKAEMPITRDGALEALKALSHQDFGFEPMDDPGSGKNQQALQKWRDWQKGQAKQAAQKVDAGS